MYLNAAFILPKKVLLNSLIMTSHRIQWVTTLGVTVKEETQPAAAFRGENTTHPVRRVATGYGAD